MADGKEFLDALKEIAQVKPNAVKVSKTDDNVNIRIVGRILDTWTKQHDEDMAMRKQYGRLLLGVLAVETLTITVIVISIGLGALAFSDETIRTLIAFSYGQIVMVTLIIVKCLFSKDSHVILKDIADIVGKLGIKDENKG